MKDVPSGRFADDVDLPMRRLVGGDASLDRAFSGLISRGGWPRRRAAAASGHCRVSTCDVLGKPSASLTLEDLALIAASALEATRTADGVVITHGAAGTAIRAAFELF